jgi:predicted Zn-dependent protease
MPRNHRNLLLAGIALLAICALAFAVVSYRKNVGIANFAFATVQESEKEDAYRNVEAARAALLKNPDDAWARIRMSGYYMDRKNYPAAIQELRTALKADPNNGKAAWRLGLLLKKVGQKGEAVQVLQKLAQSESATAWNVTAQKTLDKWKSAGEI